MPDMEKVKYDIERCICHVPDACRDCSHYKHGEYLDCMEELLKDALALLKEQAETIENREQEIRDKNERLNERAEQVDSMLKEQETANLYKCPNCGTWVSAENVVRCKDCKHASYCSIHEAKFSDDWFCADGERKE